MSGHAHNKRPDKQQQPLPPSPCTPTPGELLQRKRKRLEEVKDQLEQNKRQATRRSLGALDSLQPPPRAQGHGHGHPRQQQRPHAKLPTAHPPQVNPPQQLMPPPVVPAQTIWEGDTDTLWRLTEGDKMTLSITLLPPSLNPKDVDLHSKSATKTLKFNFETTCKEPMTLFSTTSPAETCLYIKLFMHETHLVTERREPGLVRMEGQALDKMWDYVRKNDSVEGPRGRPGGAEYLPAGGKGWVVVAPYVAEATNLPGVSYSIIAVLVPGDPNVRWFYTPYRVSDVLRYLISRPTPGLQIARELPPGSRSQRSLYVWVKECFKPAMEFPDADVFVNAKKITDYCAPIVDPDNALKRLEKREAWTGARGYHRDGGVKGKDEEVCPSDDRYLVELQPAEREIAEKVGLKCAEYLLVKREFFSAFYQEIYRSDRPISRGVTNDNANGPHTEAPARARAPDNTEDDAVVDRPATSTATNPFQPLPPATPKAKPNPKPKPFANASATPAATTPGTFQLRRTARPAAPLRNREDTPQRIGEGSERAHSPSVASTSNRPTPTPGSPIDNTPGTRTQALSGRADGRGGVKRGWKKNVRTDHAHQVWMGDHYKWKATRAKLLIIGWKEMGFLDESWYVHWIKKGGVFEGELGGDARE
ncbi:uncharacterized protein LTR77_007744 [Saxophila tyrrhenica]|uniref:Uncharacterized protein n=1 Tax=Saxophila tyrrhenica TaxID=1690608 RepID=A0AAV9P6R6_9PEZI|nr:hypothetical protein LTR77_007744 [Saxophila tyrrhenica]